MYTNQTQKQMVKVGDMEEKTGGKSKWIENYWSLNSPICVCSFFYLLLIKLPKKKKGIIILDFIFSSVKGGPLYSEKLSDLLWITWCECDSEARDCPLSPHWKQGDNTPVRSPTGENGGWTGISANRFIHMDVHFISNNQIIMHF